MNKRHDLDPTAVQLQIEYAIGRHEVYRSYRRSEAVELAARYEADKAAGLDKKRWAHPPRTLEEIDKFCDEFIEREKTRYSKVRVVETSPEKFFLVYGDTPDEEAGHGVCTGPFKTLDAAKEWFFNNGR
jgi:hypothetical protein